MVHQIAPSAFKMKKGGGHIFQLSLICTLKAIEVIKKVKKRKKDWVTGLRHLNTLCVAQGLCGSRACGSRALWLKGFVVQRPVAQGPVALRPVARGLCGSRACGSRA